MASQIDVWALLYTAGACGAVLFGLFWKGQLPESVAKPIGRITLIPQLPFTYITQTYVRNWWDELIPGSKVYIGGLPIAALGHVDQLYDLGVCTTVRQLVEKTTSCVRHAPAHAQAFQVRGVVNMCDEYHGPIDEYEKRHMKQLYLPTGKLPRAQSTGMAAKATIMVHCHLS